MKQVVPLLVLLLQSCRTVLGLITWSQSTWNRLGEKKHISVKLCLLLPYWKSGSPATLLCSNISSRLWFQGEAWQTGIPQECLLFNTFYSPSLTPLIQKRREVYKQNKMHAVAPTKNKKKCSISLSHKRYCSVQGFHQLGIECLSCSLWLGWRKDFRR